ncbi:MAG: endonuclease III [Negativicutes bacterium]|nr:endonuclease III [Negativicutes bacterium]
MTRAKKNQGSSGRPLSRPRLKRILAGLAEEYAGRGTALHYATPFEFLVAVILSAQCTDQRVNMVTKRLFPRWSDPLRLASVPVDQLAGLIRDCGLYQGKAQNISATAAIIAERYHGQLPDTREELMALPGVGRKTANVILAEIFGQPAIAVDTHVFRVARRLGLAAGDDQLTVERELMRVIPREQWRQAHHWLIWHGRLICRARRPQCHRCRLNELCPAAASAYNA